MTPMLLDINAPEFALLLVLAVDPVRARAAARPGPEGGPAVHVPAHAAGNAQDQLTRELGPRLREPRLPRPEPEFVRPEAPAGRLPIVADVKARAGRRRRHLDRRQGCVAGRSTTPRASTPAARTT